MAEELTPHAGPESEARFEDWLRQTARAFPYPTTPPLRPAGSLRPGRSDRRLFLVLALVILALLALAAGLAQFVQIGAVRLWLVSPTPTATTIGMATLVPTPTPMASVLDLAGETTLAEAQERAGFTVLLPGDLGPPDRVFYQEIGAPVVVLVWLNANGTVRLSLHEIGPLSEIAPPLEKGFDKVLLTKYGYELIRVTDVAGKTAVWVEGERKLMSGSGEVKTSRLVNSPALLWESFGITYRLEGDLTLEEAVKVAESIR